jgi:hypothetical protein
MFRLDFGCGSMHCRLVAGDRMGGEKRFYPFDYDVEGYEDCADGIEPPYMCDLSTVIESPISDIPYQGENQREDTEISGIGMRGMYLNMTSFMASCASAWTPEFLIDRDQIQHPNFTTTTITFRPSFERGNYPSTP